ncbi:succinylglutamate desuccinylase/aspartoacylase family protein [Aquamicrobium sp. LC103]|uniref:succinylglutamate desuccinylase/aspartoacylase family protein n=1 Tax=Aquamicrobium sp. LC103 TaxID=1120658 RepID=UPI00063E799F|nr:succinylglutamate desuccinylase/aspartoacylase family protein [Aquamicrobium sp. LC103]TKT69611.1 succinylglutamate desuccinylase/aspartoacylase family protein [Aquamicrobium sp. LC103]
MHSGLLHSLDFAAEGRQDGFLSIPYSIDRSPYFQIKIPIVRLKNGDGPRLLLMAGNHGDEYEGCMALALLTRRLRPETIRGELTILPFTNAPAVFAARRRSPLDDGNLNRAFPGNPNGSPTERLAAFLERDLFPRHDVMLDLHSGGTSMAHLATSLIERQGPAEYFARTLELMRALGMPYGFIAENGSDAPTSLAAAARAGIVGLSGEFGGGATVTPASMEGAMSAIDNLLIAVGVLDGPVLLEEKRHSETSLLVLNSHEQAIYADRPGWYQPARDIGDEVEAGDIAGWYHDFNRLDAPEQVLRFGRAGIVLSQRLHAMCQTGDCLVQVAVPHV